MVKKNLFSVFFGGIDTGSESGVNYLSDIAEVNKTLSTLEQAEAVSRDLFLAGVDPDEEVALRSWIGMISQAKTELKAHKAELLRSATKHTSVKRTTLVVQRKC